MSTQTPHDEFTAEERGDTHPARRAITRVIVVVGVVVLLVAVVLVGNVVSTGALLPWLARETPAPARSSSLADAARQAVADARAAAAADQSALVDAEDRRLAEVAKLDAADPRVRDEFDTVVLDAPSGVYTSYTLQNLVDLGAVRRDDDTTFTLVRNVVVREGAELGISAPGAVLRLASGPDHVVSIVGWGGSVGLGGTVDAPLTVVGWDEKAGAVDTDTSDGRAYVRVRDAVLAAAAVRFERLGYWSGRTGGLAVTTTDFGTAGLVIAETEHIGMHYGLFVSGLQGGVVAQATVQDAARDGIVVTGGAHGLVVDDVAIDGAGADGLLVDRGSGDVTVEASDVTDSVGYGIHVRGGALADGPSQSGAGITSASGLTVRDTTVRDNAAGGMRLTALDAIELDDVTVEAVQTAVRVEGPAKDVRITASDLSSETHRALDVLGGVERAHVDGTRLEGPRVALEVRDSEVEVTDSDLTVDVGHPIELSGDSQADVTGSSFSGTGQDAIVTVGDAHYTAADNDDSGWRWQPAVVGWLNEHPMMWLWGLVLVVPLVGMPLLLRRRRQHRELRRLLQDAIVAYGAAQLDDYAVDHVGPDGTPVPLGPPTPLGPVPEPVEGPGNPAPAPAAPPIVRPAARAVETPPPGYVPLEMPELWEPPEERLTPAFRQVEPASSAPEPAPSAVDPAPPAPEPIPSVPEHVPPVPEPVEGTRPAAPVVEPVRPSPSRPVSRPVSRPAARPAAAASVPAAASVVSAPRSPARATAPDARAGMPPRSFKDLRTGPLAGREFESLQQFAVAAVLEAGYPTATIAKLFRVPSWRLQAWVQQSLETPPSQGAGKPVRRGR